jgi:hypothetical protein
VRRLSLGLTAALLLILAANAAAGPAAKSVKIDASPPPWAVLKSPYAIRGTVAPRPPGLVVTLQHRLCLGCFSVC